MVVLSAGIRSLPWNSQRSGPESASRGTRATGRDHPGMVGDIISERWARSSRNGGRHHPGIAGGFLPESPLGEHGEHFPFILRPRPPIPYPSYIHAKFPKVHDFFYVTWPNSSQDPWTSFQKCSPCLPRPHRRKRRISFAVDFEFIFLSAIGTAIKVEA